MCFHLGSDWLPQQLRCFGGAADFGVGRRSGTVDVGELLFDAQSAGHYGSVSFTPGRPGLDVSEIIKCNLKICFLLFLCESNPEVCVR